MQSELFNGLPSVGSLRNHLHIRFSIDQRRDTFAEEGMIVNGKDPNHMRIAIHDFLALRKIANPRFCSNAPYATEEGIVNSASVPFASSLQISNRAPMSFARSRTPD